MNSLMKVNGIMVPKAIGGSFRNVVYDNDGYTPYVDEKGDTVKVIYNSDSNIYEIIKENKNVGSFTNQDKFIPLVYKSEYENCQEFDKLGIDIEILNNLFQNDLDKHYDLVEIFKIHSDKAFNIVWEREDYVRVGITTDGTIGFDVRSEEFSQKELERFLEVMNYIKKENK